MTAFKMTRLSDGHDISFPKGSGMGVQVDLTTIGEAVNMRRTVSGALINIADPAFRKYAFTVSAAGFKLPSIDGIWEGDLITVEAPVTLREVGSVPSRPAVSESVKIVGSYVEYSPVFTAMLVGKSQSEKEGKADASWSLDFEEI